MKRFLILCGILVLILVVADAWPARASNTVTVEFGPDLDDAGGGRTSRRHFFDHDYQPLSESKYRSWREAGRPGVERTADGFRFSYRDREYAEVWLRVDVLEWDRVGPFGPRDGELPVPGAA